MKGIIYTRVSSDEQIDGTSLASQDEFCRKYCDQKGIDVVAAFCDEGQSAKDLSLKNRAQFLAALEYCRKHRDIEAFVVFRVDRFARNAGDHFAVRKLLSSYGTALHSVTEPIGDTPAAKFIETVLAGASEYDNAVRKQRCTDGMLARINQGIWPFRPPIGYSCAHHRSRGEKKTVPDEPHPQLFLILQRGLRAYASGAITSITSLTAKLNEWMRAEGLERAVRPQLVDRMLSRYLTFYAGILVNPWTLAETHGAHQPMITRDEMLNIRRRKFGLSLETPKRRCYFNQAFPLRRLLKCAACDEYLTAATSSGNGGKYAYYYCRNGGCRMQYASMSATRVHADFSRYVQGLITNPADASDIQTCVAQLIAERRERTDATRSQNERRLTALNARRKRIFEMREDGAYDANTFRERLSVIDREIESLIPSYAHDPMARLNVQDIARAVDSMLVRLREIWRPIDRANRQWFERIVFPAGLSYNRETGCRTTELGPIFAIVRRADGWKSPKVMFEGFSSNQLADYFEDIVAFYHENRGADDEDAGEKAA